MSEPAVPPIDPEKPLVVFTPVTREMRPARLELDVIATDGVVTETTPKN